MASEWETATVFELQRAGILRVEDGNHGEYRPRSDEFESEGVAFIRAADMDAGRVLFDTASKINNLARQRITKGIGAPGDILLSHKGTVGKVAIIPDDAPPFVCSPQTTFWRCLDERVLNRRYLYAFLRSTAFGSQLATRSGETDMAPYVSLTSQRALKIPVPPLSEQRAIAHILGTLDDKIELNRRMDETLEAMVRVLFKSWFVDFDPVRAKMEGRNPGLPQHVAGLFPDRLVDSLLGRIPESWEVSEIGKEVDVVGGATPSTKEPVYWHEGKQHWATPKDLSKLSSPALLETGRRITEAGVQKISSGLLPTGTVLLSSRAPIGYLAIAEVPTAVNQGFIAMVCKRRLPNVFVLFWCFENLDYIKGISGGTTFAEISKKAFRPIPITVPPEEVLGAYEDVVRPLYDRIVANTKESVTLVQTRKLLLPKLISGEILVREAEKAVEVVA